jgi:Fe(3+) dicitrate transport protein
MDFSRVKMAFQKRVLIFLFCSIWFALSAQTGEVSGTVADLNGKPISGAFVVFKKVDKIVCTNNNGEYFLNNLPNGELLLTCFATGKQLVNIVIVINGNSLVQNFILNDLEANLNTVEINQERESNFGISRLRAVHDFAIYEGKKSEVIKLNETQANLATNNPRQVYSKVTGINIWESDGAGLQLGIGGRGLNPNRTASFNVRQNGYDISADALGYPESYYTPSTEALESIEIVRGAASLQYGTQFGGLLNFRFKQGPFNKKAELTSRQTIGSWNFINSFNSLGGTIAKGKLNYYGFFQYKQGDGYRINSGFNQVNAFVSVSYDLNSRWKLQADITKMQYLAQQAGGLTDKTFKNDNRQSFRSRNWFNVDWNLAAIQLSHRFNANTELNIRTFGLIAQRSSVGNLERINVADLGGNRTLIDGKFENIGNETRLIHRNKIGNQLQVLATGIRVYQGNTRSRQGLGSAGSNADFKYLNNQEPENSDYQFPSRNLAAFAEHIFRLNDRFSITPGLRAEYIQTTSTGYFKSYVLDGAGNIITSSRVNENISRQRQFLLGGVGLSYKSLKKLEAYANFSQNYRAINFSDLRIVNPNFSVDPNIRDEKGYTADLGLRGRIGNSFQFEITTFYIAYDGKIGQVLKTGEAPLFNNFRYRTNIADARNIGVESFLEWQILKTDSLSKKPAVGVFCNTAFVDARYINTTDKSILNRFVEMVPRFIFRTGADVRFRNWNFNVMYAYTGEHYSDATNALLTATAVEGLIPAYTVADIGLGYNRKKWSIQVNLNNALNEKYFTRRSESYPGPGIIPSDGRAIYCSVQLKL